MDKNKRNKNVKEIKMLPNIPKIFNNINIYYWTLIYLLYVALGVGEYALVVSQETYAD